MYVNRRTFRIKPGCMENAIALIKGENDKLPVQKGEMQTAVFGEFDVLIWEGRFETIDEHEKFWADWLALPTTQQFFATWNTLVEGGGKSELWQVV